MGYVLVRPRAHRDILQAASYLEDHGGFDLAQRFVDATPETFNALALPPHVGALCSFKKVADIRRWPVKSFENWLIFYRAKHSGVEIVHIIHGARDIATLWRARPGTTQQKHTRTYKTHSRT